MAAKKKKTAAKKKPAAKKTVAPRGKAASKKPARKKAKAAPRKVAPRKVAPGKAAPQKAAPRNVKASTAKASSTKPLWQKLYMTAGAILVVGAPVGYDAHLAGGGAQVVTSATAPTEHAIVFLESDADIDARVKPALAHVGAGTNLAVAYKKGDKRLHRDTLWAAMEPLGFEGVSLVAVDDTWSAMRFRRT